MVLITCYLRFMWVVCVVQKLLTAEGNVEDFQRFVRDLKATVIEAMTELKMELETRWATLVEGCVVMLTHVYQFTSCQTTN